MAQRICDKCGRVDLKPKAGGAKLFTHRCNRDAAQCAGRLISAVKDKITGEWRARKWPEEAN